MKDASDRSARTIRNVQAIPYLIPLLHPIKWARGEMKEIDNVLIVVTLSDGTQGIADAPARPTILGDTQKSLVAIVNDYFAPRLCGLDAFDLTGAWEVLNTVAGNLTAKGAIDIAIHDAQGKALGIPCAHLFGAQAKPLKLNWRIRMGAETAMLAEAEEMAGAYGFQAFKLKGQQDCQRDVRFIRELRRLVGDAVAISIDFNQSLEPLVLLKALPQLEELGVGLIEEPLPVRDTAGRLLCAQATTIPLSGDDSCLTPDDVLDELRLGAVRAVVVKVVRNGYRQARDTIALCNRFHVPVHSGSQGDMHIGAAAAAQFAYSYQARHEHEFSTFLDAADSLCEQQLSIENGHLLALNGAGIGLTLDTDKLAHYRIDQ